MTATTETARDETMSIVKATVDSFYAGALVKWPGVESWSVPPNNAKWFWPNMIHGNGGQASLACETGSRRFRRNGIIIVQCFAPLNGGGYSLAEEMAVKMRDAFEGFATASDVWFRNATINEIGPDASWYQFNLEAEFSYDEVR